MIRTELPVGSLLPVDLDVWAGPLETYTQAFEDGAVVPDVRVIPVSLEPEVGGQFILLDGAHRGRAALDAGRRMVGAVVYENNGELGPFLREHRFWWQMDTVKQVHDRYLGVWAPRMQERRGGTGLQHLRVVDLGFVGPTTLALGWREYNRAHGGASE